MRIPKTRPFVIALIAALCCSADCAQAAKKDLYLTTATVHLNSSYPTGPYRQAKVALFLRPDAPGNGDGDDWGSGTSWLPDPATGEFDDSPVKTCTGSSLVCSTYTVDSSWRVKFSINNRDYVVTSADNQSFWDWKYSGYKRKSKVDYSSNCHGYAIGTGYWVNSRPMVQYLRECRYKLAWTKKERLRAMLAIRRGSKAGTAIGHTVRITVRKCGDSPKLVGTAEQFRESGVYTQETDCAGFSVEVSKAHRGDGWSEEDFKWYCKAK